MTHIPIIEQIIRETEGLEVKRRKAPRSKVPFPTSEDLEVALVPLLEEKGFRHHEPLEHPTEESLGFEYDFWHPGIGVAVEIMGYRADDEVYKDILKFHVHRETSVGVLWVPLHKWISGKRSSTNVKAARKAVAFADTYMNVDTLDIVTYDWKDSETESTWLLHYTENE